MWSSNQVILYFIQWLRALLQYISITVPKWLVISRERKKLNFMHIEIQIRSKPSGIDIPDWQHDMIYEPLIKSTSSVSDWIHEYKCLYLDSR